MTSNVTAVVSTKICGTCKEEKPILEFSKDKTTKDGLNWKCKKCYCIYHFTYKRNKESQKIRNKEYSEKRRKETVPKYMKYSCRELEAIITEELLIREYVNQKQTLRQVAKLVPCSKALIIKYLLKYNIPIRNKSEAKVGVRNSKKHNENISRGKKGILLGPQSKETKIKRSIAMTGKVGKNSTHWKGGITPLNTCIRSMQENKDWIRKVFKKDNYTCAECKKYGGKLVAHHVKEFSLIMKEFLQLYSQFSPIDDKETLIRLAMSYAPFWEVSNGKTLCRKCHDKTYKTQKSELQELK